MGYCGEQHSGSCAATLSKRLLVDIAGYGSHLFTSESMGSVTIGSALLNMTEVIPHPFVPLVFTLVVNITYNLEETLTISCKNHELNETRQVLLQSGLCTSELQYIPSTSTLTWDALVCHGWQHEIVYRIIIGDKSKSFERVTSKTSYVLPTDIKGVFNVTVHAENVCGENFELDRALVDSSINTGGLASEDSTTDGRWTTSVIVFIGLGIIVPIVLVILIATIEVTRRVV
jgi:hypothetical protein